MSSQETRLAVLEIALNNAVEKIILLEARQTATEKFIAYMRSSATKWGSFLMGIFAFGAIIIMGVDKAKDKLIAWVFP